VSGDRLATDHQSLSCCCSSPPCGSSLCGSVVLVGIPCKHKTYSHCRFKPMSTIGKLARDAGCTVSLIRHYEREGLMPEPARTEGNQRRYGDAHRRRLLFIRHARELGFNLSDIRSLLGMATDPGASCAEVDVLARQHLAR